jgi:aminoglycoside/choline kinase family phosphotransferase
MNNAESALKSFCANFLQCPEQELAWQPLTGDASFRRYFRLTAGGVSYIAALAPPETEKNAEFVAIAKALNAVGIKAPEVLAFDLEQGFLLQSDLGSQQLLPLLKNSTADNFYQKALKQITAMIEMDSTDLKGDLDIAAYDRQALALELSYFVTWFVEQLLLYHLSDEEQAMIEDCFNKLLDAALEQPTAFVHRDYHSRNIMLDGDNAFAVIDFQDALIGPITYDAVSILRDCYIRFDDEKVAKWREDFYQMLLGKGIINVNLATFSRWFDFMSLQRHIKVLGIFARLSIRDSKHGYLDDLPMVLSYVLDVSALYSELAEFHQWLKEVILPRCQKQSWGKDL